MTADELNILKAEMRKMLILERWRIAAAVSETEFEVNYIKQPNDWSYGGGVPAVEDVQASFWALADRIRGLEYSYEYDLVAASEAGIAYFLHSPCGENFEASALSGKNFVIDGERFTPVCPACVDNVLG